MSETKNHYTGGETEFLQEVANQIALALSNMTAYEKSRKLNERLTEMAERRNALLELNNEIIVHLSEENLFQAIAEKLRKTVYFEQAAINLFDKKRNETRVLRLDGVPEGVFYEGQRLRLTDEKAGYFDVTQKRLVHDLETSRDHPIDEMIYATGNMSYCLCPILAGKMQIGTLGIGSSRKYAYTENDLDFLQEVANQIALAVTNMQAFEEIAELKTQLQSENIYLQEEILREHNFEEIIGNSPRLLEVLQQIERVAPTDASVLITGETGTGKELIARAVHNFSERKKRPLVKINCGAISAGLVESELFGHKKGAFTGAIDNRVGRFEVASGGTIFLDEVGELPLETQVKLLRVLQEGEFEPVGSSRTIKTDVRVIAATNRELEEEIKTGRFRADLYYRLNVFPIRVPPLRERRADIPSLVVFFLERFAKKFGKNIKNISADVMHQFISYDWMGNVRELQNIIERAVVLAHPSTEFLGADLFPSLSLNPQTISAEYDHSHAVSASPVALEEIERRHILNVLKQTGWRIEGAGGAAEILELHPNTLRSRLKKLGIRRPCRHES